MCICYSIYFTACLCMISYRLQNIWTCHTQGFLNIRYLIYHIISYHIIAYHITSHHITSHHIISYILVSYDIQHGYTCTLYCIYRHNTCRRMPGSSRRVVLGEEADDLWHSYRHMVRRHLDIVIRHVRPRFPRKKTDMFLLMGTAYTP